MSASLQEATGEGPGRELGHREATAEKMDTWRRPGKKFAGRGRRAEPRGRQAGACHLSSTAARRGGSTGGRRPGAAAAPGRQGTGPARVGPARPRRAWGGLGSVPPAVGTPRAARPG